MEPLRQFPFPHLVHVLMLQASLSALMSRASQGPARVCLTLAPWVSLACALLFTFSHCVWFHEFMDRGKFRLTRRQKFVS